MREALLGAPTVCQDIAWVGLFPSNIYLLLLCEDVQLVPGRWISPLLSCCRCVFVHYVATAARCSTLGRVAMLLMTVWVHVFARLYIGTPTDRRLLFQRACCRLRWTRCLLRVLLCANWLVCVGGYNLWSRSAWIIWNSVWSSHHTHHNLIFRCYWVRGQWHWLFEIVKRCLVRQKSVILWRWSATNSSYRSRNLLWESVFCECLTAMLFEVIGAFLQHLSWVAILFATAYLFSVILVLMPRVCAN